ncbi:MAG: hypothetical protein ACI8RD_009309 [Bacillariaceae sp.]|jgi:hypothetical protein
MVTSEYNTIQYIIPALYIIHHTFITAIAA